jgi:RNA 2',3'-cyclic 3'-phosphodiesterase
MRLFAAVDLDDTARAAIAVEQKRVATAMGDARSSVKWVKPDHMHLTLVFLGEVSEAQAPAVIDAVSRPIAMPPFGITFQGLGVFPSHGGPRAMWVGITDGASELTQLQHEIAQRVTDVGIALESRPFHPHLTLGRWRQSRPSDRRRVLAASRPDVLARVALSGATLYHSRISSAGPTYATLARATLSGTTPSSVRL